MVAFTPNRLYPYSQPTDPFDVPGALQAFAEAVDLDMTLLSDSIIQRPFAAVSSRVSSNQTFPADVITEAEFDFVDFDTDGISNLSIEPTRLTPTSAGFWLVQGAFEVPVSQASLHDLALRVNGGELARSGMHINNSIGESAQMQTLVGMAFMDGVDDYFTMTFSPTGGLDDFRTKNKQMSCWRLTNT